jgi:hypothetical protein
MLGSHPAVATYYELFERQGKGRHYFAEYARRHARGRKPLARARLTFSYLDELYAPSAALEAIGFKLMYSHAKENPAVLAYLARRRVRVVHLVRANLLDILVSGATARARSRFHSEGDDLAPVTVSLDPSNVVKRLGALERQSHIVRRALAVTRTPTTEVSYEDLVARPPRFAELLRFLGVADPGRELTAELTKINTSEKRSILSNYDVIESTLRGTRFAVFLD